MMRPLSYNSDELRSLLMRTKIATLDELKQALGTSIDVTVFRLNRWATSPATPIAADTIPCVKSLVSTRRVFGRRRRSGSRNWAPCFQRRSHLSIVLRAGFSPTNL